MSTSRARYNIFYHKTDDGTRLEIDFLIQRNGKLLPIEVKAEGNVRANSFFDGTSGSDFKPDMSVTQVHWVAVA